MMMWLSRPIYLWASIKSGSSSLGDHFWPTNYFNLAHDHFQNSAHFFVPKFHPFPKFSSFSKFSPFLTYQISTIFPKFGPFLQHDFPVDVPMVPSFTLAFFADGEHLTCGGFSLSEVVHLGSFDFIADYFGGLSLSPRRSNSGTAFMASTRSGPLNLRWAMMEESIEEFHTASNGGGGSSLPSPRRLDAGAPLAPIATLPWQEDALTIQSMTMVQPWMLAPRPHTGHSFD
jgi:hypothetical protein